MQKLILLTILTPFIFSQVGASWIDQNSGVTTCLNCVVIDEYVWLCGDKGVVLKGDYEGETWDMKNYGIPPEVQLNTICAVSSLILTAGNSGNNTYIYRSVNAGESWQVVFSQPGGRINSLMQCMDTMYVKFFMMGNPVGGRWSLWKSFDMGNTWDSTGMFLPQSGNEVSFPNSMFGYCGPIWFGTNNNKIYYSSNFGLNWQEQYVPEKNIYTFALMGNSGFAAGENLLFTSNRGNNWNYTFSSGSGAIKAISYSGVWMPGMTIPVWYIRGNKIYCSVDNGMSWRVEHTSSKGNYDYLNNDMYMPIAVTNAGRISKTIRGYDSSLTNPNSFLLMQNFPNPFNAGTNIKLRLYKSTHLKINVYNAAGELVNTLLDDYFRYESAWPYFYFIEVNWDGTNQPSGVYFYQVIADDYQETGKMVLVK